ncbi:hypothetical protein [Sphingomonas bacterium]|uniref:hypothetical protein n=1 Tax=Sphingomonas bacterium TaxID=1895847 RepID=UPI002612E36B|nr:hypothetical protein [Sphingomonas bacterium]MDB5679000.1 hypothetical protein [Sphingomonas bacterium]
MSGYNAPAPDGYRAVGKHRYGMTLIGLIALSIFVVVLLHHILGDKVSTPVIWMGVDAIWMIRSIVSIIAPGRQADAVIGPSARSVRIWAIIQLAAFTVLGAFWLDVWLHPSTGLLTLGGTP